MSYENACSQQKCQKTLFNCYLFRVEGKGTEPSFDYEIRKDGIRLGITEMTLPAPEKDPTEMETQFSL